MDKQKWIDEKVAKLVDEGKSQDQAVAQAHAMYDAMMKADDETTEKPGTGSQANMDEAEKALDDRAESLTDRIWQRIKERLGVRDAPTTDGFKVFKDAHGADRWIAWFSNNFEDRDGEIFSEKGFDRYVKRLDMGIVPMPKLRAWHVEGSEYGVADWVDRIGHFHVATGAYDDTAMGRAGKAYDEAHAADLGVSHGLLYYRRDKERINGKNVYKDWNTFEISPLPFRRAANDLTAFAVEKDTALKEAVMDQAKRKHLVEKFGEDAVARMEAATETRGKELEALREYKDFVNPDGTDTAAAAKATEALEQTFKDLFPELIEGQAEAVKAALQAVKAAKAAQDDNKALRSEMAVLIQQMTLRPRSVARGDDVDETALGAESAVVKQIQQEEVATGKDAALFKAFPDLMGNRNGKGKR